MPAATHGPARRGRLTSPLRVLGRHESTTSASEHDSRFGLAAGECQSACMLLLAACRRCPGAGLLGLCRLTTRVTAAGSKR